MAKILVVDDEKDVVELLNFLLLKDGYNVVTASNGKDALVLAKQEKPDLIILDIMMPEMDGYTVNTILSQDDETRSIPVIILTAKGQMRDLFAMATNIVAYIEKPFDPKLFREKIKEILKV